MKYDTRVKGFAFAFHEYVGFRHVEVYQEHLVVKHAHVELAIVVTTALTTY